MDARKAGSATTSRAYEFSTSHCVSRSVSCVRVLLNRVLLAPLVTTQSTVEELRQGPKRDFHVSPPSPLPLLLLPRL